MYLFMDEDMSMFHIFVAFVNLQGNVIMWCDNASPENYF